jgi:TolA-binding protein
MRFTRLARPSVFATALGLVARLGLGCGEPPRPAFTEAPAATLTVPPPVASQDPAPVVASDDPVARDVPVADDGMGSDIGTGSPPLPLATGPAGAARTVLASRDPRTATRRPRPRALLVVEIQGLTNLLATTSQAAPDRPILIRRIAEDYAELERIAMAPGSTAGSYGPTASGGAGDPLARAARSKAIDLYTQLEAFPAYPQLDEALYFKGIELELGGDLMGARKSYFDVIRKAPLSKWVPFAYFAFGEMFFEEAATDPSKNDLALQAYQQVLKYPSHALTAESLLRSGQVEERKGNRAQAQSFFRKVAQQFPGSSAALLVPAWARRP